MVYFRLLGRLVLRLFLYLGELASLVGQICESLLQGRKRWRQFFEQIVEIGYRSQIVVIITGGFTGAVLATQALYQFSMVDMETMGGVIVSVGMMRELGPTITGLMLAGRVGSSMAAEIGTMRVTEQIDALSTLSTNPYKYLVAPRLLAGFTMLPCCVLVADIIGVFGGYLISVHKLGFNPAVYLKNTWQFLEVIDVVSGLVKAGVFGFLIALMGCYHGYHSRGGAQGVGSATTNAVVSASILILASNYLITEAFFAQ